jgi:hypothetical protein
VQRGENIRQNEDRKRWKKPNPLLNEVQLLNRFERAMEKVAYTIKKMIKEVSP